jgi:hypothetical protein
MKTQRFLSSLMAISLFGTSAYAQTVKAAGTQNSASSKSSESVSNSGSVNAEEILTKTHKFREKMTRLLESEKAQAKLKQLGIDRHEVQTRLAAMTDAELLQVQKGVERQVGGNTIVIGTTTALLVAVLLILLL